MRMKIFDIVKEHFHELKDTEVWGGPFVPRRAGSFYKLNDGFRAFVDDKPVNFAFTNHANNDYSFYFGQERVNDKNTIITGDELVDFRLDRVAYEPVNL